MSRQGRSVAYRWAHTYLQKRYGETDAGGCVCPILSCAVDQQQASKATRFSGWIAVWFNGGSQRCFAVWLSGSGDIVRSARQCAARWRMTRQSAEIRHICRVAQLVDGDIGKVLQCGFNGGVAVVAGWLICLHSGS